MVGPERLEEDLGSVVGEVVGCSRTQPEVVHTDFGVGWRREHKDSREEEVSCPPVEGAQCKIADLVAASTAVLLVQEHTCWTEVRYPEERCMGRPLEELLVAQG